MASKLEPRCPYFGTCGGCDLQDIPYSEQLLMKQRWVEDSLKQHGVAVAVDPTLGMEDPWFYRNKIQFPIREMNNQLIMGYFKRGTHEIVNIQECYIQDPYLTEIAQVSREVFQKRGLSAYDEKTGKGLLRHFIGRSGFNTSEMLLGIVVNAKGIPAAFTVADEIKKRERLMQRQYSRHNDYPEPDRKKKIVGIVQNVNTSRGNVILGQQTTNLLGISFFRERLGGFKFDVQLHSFFQNNPVQAEVLYNLVAEYADLNGTELVVDAYAGIGTIAFWLCQSALSVIGIEENESAVKDSVRNLRLNEISNIKMIKGSVEKDLPKKADVMVLDPPRSGCSERALRAVLKSRPSRIIYVSCNPKTLGRDLAHLEAGGYETKNLTPVDMFPQTNHVEAVALLLPSARS